MPLSSFPRSTNLKAFSSFRISSFHFRHDFRPWFSSFYFDARKVAWILITTGSARNQRLETKIRTKTRKTRQVATPNKIIENIIRNIYISAGGENFVKMQDNWCKNINCEFLLVIIYWFTPWNWILIRIDMKIAIKFW